MSGETEKDVSGLTTDTLRMLLEQGLENLGQQITLEIAGLEKQIDILKVAGQQTLQQVNQHFEARIDNFEKRLIERAEAQKQAVEQVRMESEKSLANADKAILKSEAAAEKRFESVNEFRAQLADQAALFMPREVATAALEDIKNQIGAMRSRLDSGEGTTKGQQHGVTNERAERAEDRARAMMIFAAVSFLVTVVTLANLFIGR